MPTDSQTHIIIIIEGVVNSVQIKFVDSTLVFHFECQIAVVQLTKRCYNSIIRHDLFIRPNLTPNLFIPKGGDNNVGHKLFFSTLTGRTVGSFGNVKEHFSEEEVSR